MLLRSWGRSARVAAGIATLLTAGACAGDSSSPMQPSSITKPSTLPNGAAARTETAATLGWTRKMSRRVVRQADGTLLKIETLAASDGRSYVVESTLDANGLPRALRVLQGGQPIARITNEWQEQAHGFALQRQHVVHIAHDGTTREFDSQSLGGVARIAGGEIAIPKRTAPVAVQGGMSALRGGFLSYNGSDDFTSWASGGPCDAQARAVDAALDGWLVSIVALGGAYLSGNPLATLSAWAYEVKAWRDFTRAEQALDQCVADAGKKPYEY